MATELTTSYQDREYGTLTLILGPMYSGKTTALNRRATETADVGHQVCKIVHTFDDRNDVSSNSVSGSTHNSTFTSLTKKVTVIRASHLKDVDVSNYQFIYIDEGQFFDDLLETVKTWLLTQKHITVAGLDGDCFMKPFGQIIYLVPLADKVKKKTAFCSQCLKESGMVTDPRCRAPFTKRTTKSTDQIVIGGSDVYQASCRYHHDL